MRVHLIAAAGLAALLLAGCSNAAPAGAPATDAPAQTTALDWTTKQGTFRFGNGWTAAFCEGDAPFVCVRDGDTVLGTLELITAPADDDFDPRQHIAGFIDTFRQDRAAGCPGHRLEPVGPAPASVGGTDGLRYGFRLIDPDGAEVERVVKYLAAADGTMLLVGANASDPDGCMAGGVGEFVPEDLAAIEEELDELVATSRLPAEPEEAGEDAGDGDAAVADGEHEARVEVFHDDAVELDLKRLLTGEEARHAAVEDGELPPGEDLPNDFYVDDQGDQVHRLEVSEDITVEVYDCTQECELVPVDYADLAAGRARGMNGVHTLYQVTVTDGVVVALREIYLP